MEEEKKRNKIIVKSAGPIWNCQGRMIQRFLDIFHCCCSRNGKAEAEHNISVSQRGFQCYARVDLAHDQLFRRNTLKPTSSFQFFFSWGLHFCSFCRFFFSLLFSLAFAFLKLASRGRKPFKKTLGRAEVEGTCLQNSSGKTRNKEFPPDRVFSCPFL